ncbi:hypothetical protein [uncultured Sulfitobacter sp.]|uniref:hypothetical protein n=1 Tax=uncultured Sulfitobacter sp. TaxID=191468 RepID=UPI00260E86F8|nr:hypothetical protein [uncultured Sulfitobacter sp.]
MSSAKFWDNVLEHDEELLWTGRPKPRLHWRNWRLYGSAPMAATGLLVAAWFIIATVGAEGDMWLLVLPALLVLIPLRATRQQLQTYAATRYALTDRRALFFQVGAQETRVKAYPASAMTVPERRNTLPPSITFLQLGSGKDYRIGFDYVEKSSDLRTHLERMTQ